MDEWLNAEIWHYKKRNRQMITDRLGYNSDLSEDNLELIISAMAEMHVMMLSSGPVDVYIEFMAYKTRPVRDTKIARVFHKGSIVSIEDGELRILK